MVKALVGAMILTAMGGIILYSLAQYAQALMR